MGMRSQIVRANGECTECGQPATHVGECAPCHIATLAIVVIKGKYWPAELSKVTEGFCKADLLATRKDSQQDPSVKHIANIVCDMSFAHKLYINDVQKRITERLRVMCKSIDEETDEQREEYMGRVTSWIGTIVGHLKKKGKE